MTAAEHRPTEPRPVAQECQCWCCGLSLRGECASASISARRCSAPEGLRHKCILKVLFALLLLFLPDRLLRCISLAPLLRCIARRQATCEQSRSERRGSWQGRTGSSYTTHRRTSSSPGAGAAPPHAASAQPHLYEPPSAHGALHALSDTESPLGASEKAKLWPSTPTRAMAR